MTRLLARSAARHAAKHAAKHAHRRGWLNVRLGMALFRDRRVSVGTKLLALGLGLGLTMIAEALQLPLEGIFAALMPLVGIVLDVAIDGLELIALPMIFGSILLTHLAPRMIVDDVAARA